MAKFFIIMQHTPTPEQRAEGAERFGEIVELGNKALLNVPEDPELGRDWFVQRATEILDAIGGVWPGDTVMAMGQQQLALAVNAEARRRGACLVEAVTRRESVDESQPDGSVKKTNLFRHAGFRALYEF